jgi:PX-associated
MSTSTVSANNVQAAEDEPNSDYELTPLRAHYLKKSLIQLQFTHEMNAITTASQHNVSAFSYLGRPFAPPPAGAPLLDLPFLRYIFRQYVLTFPFMAAAPKDFYSDKLQPFLAAALSRNLSSVSILDDGQDGSEQEARLKIVAKFEKNLSLFLGSATKLIEHEEVVRLSSRDLERLELLAKKRQAKYAKARGIFEVNIIGVRTVVDKGRMRSRAHEVSILTHIVVSSNLMFAIGIYYPHPTVKLPRCLCFPSIRRLSHTLRRSNLFASIHCLLLHVQYFVTLASKSPS